MNLRDSDEGETMSDDACCADKKCDNCACKEEPPQPLTADAARAHVARATARSLRASVEEIELMISDMVDSVEKENGKLLAQATKELHDSLLMMAKKFDRPLILRPDRSRKAVGVIQ